MPLLTVSFALAFINGTAFPDNTHFVRGSNTVRLTSCLTGLDSTKLVNLYLIQHKQSI